MKSITTQLGPLTISETVHLAQWSGIDQRMWHVFRSESAIAELTFSIQELLIQITKFSIEDRDDTKDVGCELLLLIQQQFPSHWIEVPSTIAPANMDEIITAKKENDARREAKANLDCFNEIMLKAEEAFFHMRAYEWDFSGRMDFYARYPGYFNQDEIREKLTTKLQLLPSDLIHVSRPSLKRAMPV
jgi:hypothetical protein